MGFDNDVDISIVNLDGVAPDRLGCRHCQGFPGAQVEHSRVVGTFDLPSSTKPSHSDAWPCEQVSSNAKKASSTLKMPIGARSGNDAQNGCCCETSRMRQANRAWRPLDFDEHEVCPNGQTILEIRIRLSPVVKRGQDPAVRDLDPAGRPVLAGRASSGVGRQRASDFLAAAGSFSGRPARHYFHKWRGSIRCVGTARRGPGKRCVNYNGKKV
jgi:hypothetical protein